MPYLCAELISDLVSIVKLPQSGEPLPSEVADSQLLTTPCAPMLSLHNKGDAHHGSQAHTDGGMT